MQLPIIFNYTKYTNINIYTHIHIHMCVHQNRIYNLIPCAFNKQSLVYGNLKNSCSKSFVWTSPRAQYVKFESRKGLKRYSVQFSSVAQSCPTLCDPMDCSTPSFPDHHQLPELAQAHVHQISDIPSNHLILCRPLLLLPSIFLNIRVFSNESGLHIRWPKYWSFSFSISPSNEQSGLISFRIAWLNLLAVQGTLKSLFPTPQFKRVNSLALSFLYCPSLTSKHDYQKNHSFDYTDHYWQSNVSAF